MNAVVPQQQNGQFYEMNDFVSVENECSIIFSSALPLHINMFFMVDINPRGQLIELKLIISLIHKIVCPDNQTNDKMVLTYKLIHNTKGNPRTL